MHCHRPPAEVQAAASSTVEDDVEVKPLAGLLENQLSTFWKKPQTGPGCCSTPALISKIIKRAAARAPACAVQLAATTVHTHI